MQHWCGRMRRSLLALAVTVSAVVMPATPRPSAVASGQPAYLLVDLPSGSTLASARPDLLDTPVAGGSIVKIATLMAALESGTIDEDTALPCRGTIDVDGHRLTCVHPIFNRPLTPVEALAHSCNDFFATIGRRVPRAAFNQALIRLGLPPIDERTPLAAACLGLDQPRATPRAWLTAMTRVASEEFRLHVKAATLRTLREGLRGAASYGTAAVFRERGLSALAKTGTTVTAGGRSLGLVVASVPEVNPTRGVVVVAPGGSGGDAARIAADLVLARNPPAKKAGTPPRQPQSTGPGLSVRVGITRPTGGYAIVTMPLEIYVARVVAGEQSPASHPAALQALAITARTFALANLGRHTGDGFDLCDLTHCQVLGRETPDTRAAASATAGQVLLDRGRVASVYYTASCGGHTERPSAVWPGAVDVPYLPAVADPGCERQPAWTAELAAADLRRALTQSGLFGDRLTSVTVLARSASGRVSRIGLEGLSPPELTGEQFRLAVGRALGWQHLKSTLFAVTRTAAGYRFTGRGSGHGVGLCVAGAVQRAVAGADAASILQAYFPGLRVGLAPAVAGNGGDAHRRADESAVAGPPQVLLSLPAWEEQERQALATLVAAALREIGERTGVTPPGIIRVEVTSTVEAFQRQTGMPWWTAGLTRGQHITLLPITILRRRNILEQTLRHELAHVLTAPALERRPLWVKEGAALVFGSPAGTTGIVGPRESSERAACPSDAELQRPASLAAQQAAYARAAACFTRALAGGQRWTDIR